MDIGKAKLQIATTYDGDIESGMQDFYTAMVVLTSELAVTPGLAAIPTSVAVSRGQAVQIFNGQLRLADASLNRPAVGIVVGAAAIGQKALIVLGMGYARGLTGLTANSSAYLGNAGAIVFAKPGAGFIQGLGYCLSATELWVSVNVP